MWNWLKILAGTTTSGALLKQRSQYYGTKERSIATATLKSPAFSHLYHVQIKITNPHLTLSRNSLLSYEQEHTNVNVSCVRIPKLFYNLMEASRACYSPDWNLQVQGTRFSAANSDVDCSASPEPNRRQVSSVPTACTNWNCRAQKAVINLSPDVEVN